MKIELDPLELLLLIRACYFAESDYRSWSKSVCLEDRDRRSFIDNADEYKCLSARLDVLFTSRKVED